MHMDMPWWSGDRFRDCTLEECVASAADGKATRPCRRRKRESKCCPYQMLWHLNSNILISWKALMVSFYLTRTVTRERGMKGCHGIGASEMQHAISALLHECARRMSSFPSVLPSPRATISQFPCQLADRGVPCGTTNCHVNMHAYEMQQALLYRLQYSC